MGILIINVQQHEVTATRFRVSGRSIILDRQIRLETSPSAGLSGAADIREEDDTVILAVPPSFFSCRETALPLADRRKIREVLPLELKGETASDSDELVFDCVLRGNGTQLAIWGRKSDLRTVIDQCTAAGLEPRICSASLFHWGDLIPASDAGSTVLLADRSGAAVYRSGELLMFHSFWDQDPLAEIDRTVAALSLNEGITVERVFLMGDLAATGIPDGKKDLWSPLPVSAELSESFRGDRQTAAAEAGAWALARVAARKKVPVNFLHGELARTISSRIAWKKLLLPAILAATAIFLLALDLGVRYWFVRSDLASLNKSISGIYREIFPGRKKAVDETGEVKSEIKRLSGTGGGINALSTLKRLAELKKDDATSFYETEIDGKQLLLKGDARSVQAVTDLKERVGGLMTGIEVGEIKTRPDGSASFTLRGSLKEEGK